MKTIKITIEVPEAAVGCNHACPANTLLCKYCGIHNDLIKFLPEKQEDIYGT